MACASLRDPISGVTTRKRKRTERGVADLCANSQSHFRGRTPNCSKSLVMPPGAVKCCTAHRLGIILQGILHPPCKMHTPHRYMAYSLAINEWIYKAQRKRTSS